MKVTKKEMLYEGKAKKVWSMVEDDDCYIVEFKDSLTAFNGLKKAEELGKGALNNKISTQIFKMLETKGIKTHLVDTISDNEQVVKKCKIIPLEVVVRNIATGSLTKRLGIKDGTVLPFTLVEFCYKVDELNDPILNDDHCLILNAVENIEELNYIRETAKKINNIMHNFFKEKGLKLVDFKIEFGKDKDGNIILADEISPDSCRFWDAKTNEKLDKDRFRQGLGGLKVAYEEVLNRILS
ncbi:phosphoribosylaminoimidazole-succinocarboxamide synthase [Campylobacter blaseri]|uniref:Phosphoribosylaminoimidazole-succinocarboxamide synthase n=1 Tax=Campylobacter blaseri TaxID=2042961 RepID=A0A2P8QYS4_9BACT|nr:phosphoribosylaminoimidazolesuccinocarboxamide synthase [Campylobacter blaseri]PSM51395.1 phosphoribosylaminoimidazolesuccinocarboxamide synthase [Campylobacter blaseri]PSM52845.1 phosphoribosylaminoimidazolesuccinocarboxamide synthase [Campylobacter blaseri]QKF86148.1 phosphoribosylaminoimidazole-succinocarboxamide synthase [Campylobacter blaseri]